MTPAAYAGPPGGLPPQTRLLTDRAVFTNAYAVIPRGVQRDIVTSALPGWRRARFWVLARPLSGFAETFAQMIVEIGPGGGSDAPEPEPAAEAVLFVTAGTVDLSIDDAPHALVAGGYAYLPPGARWTIANPSAAAATLHWIRKRWAPAPGLSPPEAFVTSDVRTPAVSMPGAEGRWVTQRFVDPDDLRHDMHVNIVTFSPGAVIPFAETHVMEHGLYILEGKAVYRLNEDWVEVEAGDFLWLRAFCPQGCYAGGPGPFRYLLYKDVNRHPPLSPP